MRERRACCSASSIASLLGLFLSVGMTSGLAINVGHKLDHQTSPLERWFAKIALAPVPYEHFYVENSGGSRR